MTQYVPTAKVVHGLSNEEYRSAHGDSATVLKGCCDKSATHALTPKPNTRAMNTGLKLHEYILERDKFLSTYGSGLDKEAFPDALDSLEQLRAEVDKMNESRLPLLKTPASKDALLKVIADDNPEHLKNVQDIDKLKVSDLKDKIAFINSAPNRGLLRKPVSTMDTYLELAAHGWQGHCWQYIDKMYNRMIAQAGYTMLPFEEYSKYELMHQSMITFLREAAEDERESGEGLIMQWLLHGFASGATQNEVSMFGDNDKCRFDALINIGEKSIGIDVKKARDASPEGFAKAAANLHYDLQAVHYTSVAEECNVPLGAFVFIAIEDYPPYACAVYVADESFNESGNKKRTFAKKCLQSKRDSGKVSAYETVAKTIPLPAWSEYGAWNED